MSWSARYEDDKKETFDDEKVLDKKLNEVVKLIENSNHMIFFTGAGISTSIGIPDFRSGLKTKSP